MRFAWWGKYRLRISQRRDVIRRRLAYETTNLETEMFARRVLFTGNVEEDSFKIMRTRIASKASDLCTRDSGSPVLHGHMYEADEETIIDIKWNLPMLSVIFACIWLTGIGFGLFVVIMAQDFAAIFWVTVMLAIGLWMFFPGVGSSLTEVKKTLIDVIVAPGESWREYEGDKGDEWNV
ncbi:MAG: hypothetical protein IKJ77_00895 [Firmicutes bacterium]|nr:hypothetical protein [Bacillota bacterium]